MKKRTHEEYIKELMSKNDNLTVIDNYIDANTKIKHFCKKHDIYFETTPTRALMGVGCELCKKEKFNKKRTMSNEEFVSKLKILNIKIVPLEKYISIKTPMLFLCKKHNIKWKSIPSSILCGHGCHECMKEKIGHKNKKPYSAFRDELKLINQNIKCIGNYKNSTTKTRFKCLIDGYEWDAVPSQILSGKGCPKCSNTIKKTTDEYIRELATKNPNVEVLDVYVNARTPIRHRCKIHNYTYTSSPSSVLNSNGCKYCGIELSNKNKRRTRDEYIRLLCDINPNIEVVGNYVNSNTAILHRCLIDGTEWNAFPSNILSGSGCPQCKSSRGEQKISKWLNNHNIRFEQQKRFDGCKNKKPLPFDFYLPDYNMCIEFDGEQHFREIDYFGGTEAFKNLKKNDEIKNTYCKNNSIKLLRILWNNDIETVLSNNFL